MDTRLVKEFGKDGTMDTRGHNSLPPAARFRSPVCPHVLAVLAPVLTPMPVSPYFLVVLAPV